MTGFFEKQRNLFILSFLVSTLFFTCKEKDLVQLDFAEVETVAVEFKGLGEIELQGKINFNSSEKADIIEWGFLYSKSQFDPLEATSDTIRVVLEEKNDQGDFKTIIKGLNLNTEYHYAAYAIFSEVSVTEKRKKYGLVKSFSFGISLSLDQANITIKNDTIELLAKISGLIKEDNLITVDSHGYVCSHLLSEPTVWTEDGVTISFGTINDDDEFQTGRFEGLEFKQPYYCRAWAASNDTIYYSSVRDTVIPEGWKQTDSLNIPLVNAVGIAFQDFGFVFTGCFTDVDCSRGQYQDHLYRFDPRSLSWSYVEISQSHITDRSQAIAYTISNELYLGFGEKIRNSGAEEGLASSFYYLNNPIISNIWQRLLRRDVGLDLVKDRKGAISFTLKNRVYIGSGSSARDTNGIETYFADFWEFNPDQDTFRQVASMPIDNGSGSNNIRGRSEAVSFVIEEGISGPRAFVGSGITSGGFQLKDFWEFIPPDPSNPADTGRWEFHSFFPGLSRSEAVAFAIGDKAYFGTGVSQIDGNLNDFWEFYPGKSGAEAWTKRTDYQGPKVQGAVGFTINGKGYLGTGRISETVSSNQFWVYTPE